MTIPWLLLAVPAAAYQGLALASALLRPLKRAKRPDRPGVSVLKPMRGLDPGVYENLRSHASQQYPEFEVLLGVADPADPVVAEIERLLRDYPAAPVRLVRSTTRTPNAKAGVLADLAAAARYPILLVNDSDIRVEPDYLGRVVSALDDSVGVVTCLYRARASSWPGRFEALGIATDFVPSVLVARLIGVSEFGLGSTLCFRRSDLERIGGFASIADYIADDYQLSRRIRALGPRVELADCVVETSLPDQSWAEVWRHQLRWARTIRLARGGGYAGLPIANGTLWALFLAVVGHWLPALMLLALRMAEGVAASVVLADRSALRDFWLMPLRDLFGLAIWAAGLFGHRVVWRDQVLTLDREGRILERATVRQP